MAKAPETSEEQEARVKAQLLDTIVGWISKGIDVSGGLTTSEVEGHSLDAETQTFQNDSGESAVCAGYHGY